MTELLYMRPDAPTSLETTVLEISDGAVILAATVFYAQGGGQPSDIGLIVGASGTFRVEKVQNTNGTIYHHGEFIECTFGTSDIVRCEVDADRRRADTLLHSGGHLLDLAVRKLGFGWVPGKGYHFPDGPYVEYTGTLDDSESIAREIERVARELVAENLPVRIEFMDRTEMEKVLSFVPEYLPANRPSRVVFMGDAGIPCGGTHVRSLGEIDSFRISKVRMKGGSVRVSYSVV